MLFIFLQKCLFWLFDTLPVRAGNFNNEDLILGRQGNIQNGVPVALGGVLYFILFLKGRFYEQENCGD